MFWMAGLPFSIGAKNVSVALRTRKLPSQHLRSTCTTRGCVRYEHISAGNVKDTVWFHVNATLASKQAAQADQLENPETAEQLRKRFMKFVRVETDHWIWMGGKIRGFPQFTLFGKPISAKRVALAFRLKLLHQKVRETCGLKHCVRPEHLEPKI